MIKNKRKKISFYDRVSNMFSSYFHEKRIKENITRESYRIENSFKDVISLVNKVNELPYTRKIILRIIKHHRLTCPYRVDKNLNEKKESFDTWIKNRIDINDIKIGDYMLVTNLTIIEPEYCISSTNTNFKDHDIYLGKDLTKDNNEYVVKIVEIDEDEEYDDYDDSGCIVVKRKKIYAIGQKTHENDSEEFYTSQLSNKCSDEQIEKYKENRFQWKKEQLISKKESIEKKIVSSKEALLKVHKDIAELEK